MNALRSAWLRAGAVLPDWQAERDARHPARAQRDVLLRILRKNAATDYGRRYGFGTVRGVQDFARRVPVVEYADLESDVERMKQGQGNVLTAERTILFALTSGTSDRPKFIPITRSGQKRTVRLMTQWFARAWRDHPALFDHGLFDITGAAVEGRCAGGLPYGSASGLIRATLPGVIQGAFCLPPDVADIADYALRYYAMARCAYARKLSFLGTPNPLTLVQLAGAGARHAEEIVRCVRRGCFSDSVRSARDCVAADVPPSLQASLRPDPARADFLARIRAETGGLKPRDCWPELALIGCWLGGSIGFHAEALRADYGPVPRRDLGYLASEGSITLPLADDTPAGLLALRNHYYEFIPLAEGDASEPAALGAQEVEAGRCYRILLTNENGLYRYDINDVVRVEGFHQRAPLISFVRKSGAMTSIAGEKLHLNQLLLAMQRVQARFALEIRRFRAAPDPSLRRYDIFVDLPGDPPAAFLRDSVLPALDEALGACNIEYAAKRRSGRLLPPRLHLMEAGWPRAAELEHASFSKRDTQYKWLPLVSERLAADARCIRLTVEAGGATFPPAPAAPT